MTDRCAACGKPIVLVNVDKMRGVIGLTMGWIHVSRRANRNHRAIPEEELGDDWSLALGGDDRG